MLVLDLFQPLLVLHLAQPSQRQEKQGPAGVPVPGALTALPLGLVGDRGAAAFEQFVLVWGLGMRRRRLSASNKKLIVWGTQSMRSIGFFFPHLTGAPSPSRGEQRKK